MSRLKYFFFIFSVYILWLFLVVRTSSAYERVRLRDVTSLTLRRGEYTTARRSSPIPQLECVGGTASGKYTPKVVQCYNRGFDGIDVQWECKAQMSSDYDFGKIEVSCEGYDFPEDPYILAGSCGLRYHLDYTNSGARKHSIGIEDRINYTGIIYFVVACFVVYLIYTTIIAPRHGNEGDRSRGGGFDHGPGYPPGGGQPPPPPGWRNDAPPSYDDSCKYGRASGASAPPAGDANAGGSGPGFFTGLGLGALGGYLFGNNNNAGYGETFRRRNYANYGYPSTERHHYYYDSDRSNEPSTSGTHTSSGFGGTTRR